MSIGILIPRRACVIRTSHNLGPPLSALSFGQGVRRPDVGSTGAMRGGIIARGINGSLTGWDTGIPWVWEMDDYSNSIYAIDHAVFGLVVVIVILLGYRLCGFC